MIFKFSYIKHNKFGRKGTINNIIVLKVIKDEEK